nr:RNA-directed DNA polymerase, eukaryota, reverse transcriptase zinc-binding domain protein [Tanacetum cinerariifolium]
SRLSKWKTKTLSIGGRLTLLKSVLGASPIYCMSIFKAPKGVLKEMESIRNMFFIGADNLDKKITWVAWNKVLASKKNGGLGVSSYFGLNRALLFKWIWRFVSQDDSLWFHVMQALYGPNIDSHSVHYSSNWCSILKEMQMLKAKEMEKNCMVATKMAAPVDASFRRSVRGGIELVQFNELRAILESVSLSHSHDRWICSASSDGSFRVKDIRNLIDDLILPSGFVPTKWMKMPRGGVEHENYGLLCSKVVDLVLLNISDIRCWSLEGSQEFSVKSSRILIDNTILPKAEVPTRWLRVFPIKLNVHAWRVCLDKLPTRANISLRGMDIPSIACPLCNSAVESFSHIFFACPLARQV